MEGAVHSLRVDDTQLWIGFQILLSLQLVWYINSRVFKSCIFFYRIAPSQSIEGSMINMENPLP